MNTTQSGPIYLTMKSTPAELAMAWLHGVALLQQGIDDTAHSGDAQLLVSNLREGLVGFDLLPALPAPFNGTPPTPELSAHEKLYVLLQSLGAETYSDGIARVESLKAASAEFAQKPAAAWDPNPEQMLEIIADQVGAQPNDYFGIATAIQHLRERAGVREAVARRAAVEFPKNTTF